MPDIAIHFDGGCKPTNPGQKYGSYDVLVDGHRIQRVEKKALGWGTNNEAEFQILIEALTWLEQHPIASLFPKEYSVTAYTDSKIVSNRLSGKNFILTKRKYAEASTRMYNLAFRCLEIAGQFGSFEVEWRGRAHNVQRFGH
jgi:ribonuclease HI